MSRPPAATREQLIERVSEHVAKHGIQNSTMRSLAAAIGTSTTPLTHYFGSREQLFVEVAAHNEEIQRRVALRQGEGIDGVRRYWQWTTEPENLGRVRFELELLIQQSLESRKYGPREGDSYHLWLRETAAMLRKLGMSTADSRREAHVLSALLVGLQINLLATATLKRSTDALEHYLRGLEERIAATKPKQHPTSVPRQIATERSTLRTAHRALPKPEIGDAEGDSPAGSRLAREARRQSM